MSAFLFSGCTSTTTKPQEAPRELIGFLKYTGNTYSPFKSNEPYKYCVYGIDGDFVAYLDSTQLLTSNMERFFGRLVVLRGSLTKVDGEPVIKVENLKFR